MNFSKKIHIIFYTKIYFNFFGIKKLQYKNKKILKNHFNFIFSKININ